MGCGPSSAAEATPANRRNESLTQRVPAPIGGDPLNRRFHAGIVGMRWTYPEPVSRPQLDAKRQTFWETAPQAGGRRAVWDNLRLISETVLASDLELASTLVNAAELRIPHGDLSVVYDSQGRQYELPRFVFSDPANLLSDEEAAKLANSSSTANAKVVEHKGPITTLEVILRISPSQSAGDTRAEQDIPMKLPSDMTVKTLKQTLHEKLVSGSCDQTGSAEVKKPNKWIGAGLTPARQRIMMRGRELKDQQHMQECGVENGYVLQIFVRPE